MKNGAFVFDDDARRAQSLCVSSIVNSRPHVVFESLGNRRFRVCIAGELPLGWAALAASNLTQRGCDLERANASLDRDGQWAGSFEGQRAPSFAGISNTELFDKGQRSASSLVPSIVYRSITRDRSSGHLDVHIRARDESGLLAELLGRFGMLGLFPHSFDVRTDLGHADDRFRLCGIGGSAVSERAAREVERLLERWSTRPASVQPRSA